MAPAGSMLRQYDCIFAAFGNSLFAHVPDCKVCRVVQGHQEPEHLPGQ